MKQQVNPAIIAGAVVVVALVIFGIYKVTMGSGSNGAVSKDNAPDYAKAAQRGQGMNMASHYQQEQAKKMQSGGAPGGGYGRPGMGGYGGGQ